MRRTAPPIASSESIQTGSASQQYAGHCTSFQRTDYSARSAPPRMSRQGGNRLSGAPRYDKRHRSIRKTERRAVRSNKRRLSRNGRRCSARRIVPSRIARRHGHEIVTHTPADGAKSLSRYQIFAVQPREKQQSEGTAKLDGETQPNRPSFLTYAWVGGFWVAASPFWLRKSFAEGPDFSAL